MKKDANIDFFFKVLYNFFVERYNLLYTLQIFLSKSIKLISNEL